MERKHFNIVVSPDSFKGSASANDVAHSIKKGLESNNKCDIDVISCPIADGGEGTLDAIVKKENIINIEVSGPLFEKVKAEYGYIGKTAVIEMAKASGLTLIDIEKRSAIKTSTYGVGEMINDALKRGFRDFIITLGGSATNDGGCGMFSSLGATFLDKNGKSFIPTGGSLCDIDTIDLSHLNPVINECSFIIATDVTNPLTGNEGATMVYGKQKGASDEELELIENGMKHYSDILYSMTGKDISKIKGSGAAGGLGVPLLVFCKSKIQSGIESVLNALDYENIVKNADIIITGEGKIDRQSLYGKAISGVSKYAKKYNKPVYCFVGTVGDDIEEIKKMGICDVFSVSDMANSVYDSMNNATKYLTIMASKFVDYLSEV